MILLGVSGKRESGKSLLASYLEHYHGYTRFSLADDLKRRVMKDFGLTADQLWGVNKEVETNYLRTNQFHLFKDTSELFWIVGFFEGEGSAGCNKVSGQNYFHLRADISQENLRPIEFVKNYFGFGSITEHKYTDEKRLGKCWYTWTVWSNDARIFLNRILPYMKHPGKIDQVITAIKLDEEKVIPRPNKKYLTPREIMIQCGLFYRTIDPLFWCKQFDSRIGDKVVIDDIRFVNEINYFKDKHGARFVRLERHQELCPHKVALDDFSETELDKYKDWDLRLEADLNKTPDDLKKFATYVAERMELAF